MQPQLWTPMPPPTFPSYPRLISHRPAVSTFYWFFLQHVWFIVSQLLFHFINCLLIVHLFLQLIGFGHCLLHLKAWMQWRHVRVKWRRAVICESIKSKHYIENFKIRVSFAIIAPFLVHCVDYCVGLRENVPDTLTLIIQRSQISVFNQTLSRQDIACDVILHRSWKRTYLHIQTLSRQDNGSNVILHWD